MSSFKSDKDTNLGFFSRKQWYHDECTHCGKHRLKLKSLGHFTSWKAKDTLQWVFKKAPALRRVFDRDVRNHESYRPKEEPWAQRCHSCRRLFLKEIKVKARLEKRKATASPPRSPTSSSTPANTIVASDGTKGTPYETNSPAEPPKIQEQKDPAGSATFSPPEPGEHPALRSRRQPLSETTNLPDKISERTEISQQVSAPERQASSEYSFNPALHSMIEIKGTDSDAQQHDSQKVVAPYDGAFAPMDGFTHGMPDTGDDEEAMISEQSQQLANDFSHLRGSINGKLREEDRPEPPVTPPAASRSSSLLGDFPSPPSEPPGSGGYRTAPQTPARAYASRGNHRMSSLADMEQANVSTLSMPQVVTPDRLGLPSSRNSSAQYELRTSSGASVYPNLDGLPFFAPAGPPVDWPLSPWNFGRRREL